VVPGYYAADGDAANSSASTGNRWRAHFAPDEVGVWNYTVSFRTGTNVATTDTPGAGTGAGYFDGQTGSFQIGPSDKTGRDFRGKGRLDYVGKHHLRFAGNGQYFMKAGVDAPENLLAYQDFDGEFKTDGEMDQLVKTWAPHVADWQPGDPVWQGTKGKGLIGALNYLAAEGLNAVSFLTMNIDGDDRNVFPYPTDTDFLRMDVSRLDQWEIVFAHATCKGLHLNFKTQETENELLLDGGNTGNQRKLYYRELIARFGHHLALNWNLGEEINGASLVQKQAWANYFHVQDPYRHPIVIHNGATHYNMMGNASKLTGFSLQLNAADFTDMFAMTKDYIDRSAAAGKPWVVACDEPGDSRYSLRPDNDPGASHVNARKNALWGNIMAGGAGCEFYFGYALPNSDLTCQDFRSRDAFWDCCQHAIRFFEENPIPFQLMRNHNEVVSGNGVNANRCLARIGDTYLVQLHGGGSHTLNLTGSTGTFTVKWFNPRDGGPLVEGTPLEGGSVSPLGSPPSSPGLDWIALVQSTSGGGGTNTPPVVDAGPDRSGFLVDGPLEVLLEGSVNDDGLPGEFQVTRFWSLVSGPAPVTFSDASAASPRATFTAEGSYVLRLLASDFDLSASDEVSVEVRLPETTGRRVYLPDHDAFIDDGFNRNTNLLRTGFGERITYLRFDLTALDAAPTGAVLRLTEGANSASPGVTLHLHAATSNDWTESTLSGSNRPAKGPELSTVTGPVGAGESRVFPLADHITGPGIYTFILESDPTESGAAFASKEHASVASRPVLELAVTGNTSPVFSGRAYSTEVNRALVIPYAELLAGASDADGDPVTFVIASGATSAGGNLVMGPESLTYTPSIDFTGPDSFPLTVQDGRGTFSTASFAIQVTPLVSEVFARIPTLSREGESAVRIRFLGIPAFDHRIQRSTDLLTWTTLATVNGGATGEIDHLDPAPPAGAAFYRIATP
jgi:Bacterial Ig domain/Domain of unknown function (DUF5060)